MSLQPIQDVEILAFIAHIVDHKAPEPDLTDLETPLTEAFPHRLFEEYIRLALRDDNRRLARFRAADGAVIGQLRSLQAFQTTFVEASRQIARHLHSVMKASKNPTWITPGDLMVALFRDRQATASGASYLALLKVDLSDAVIRRVEEVGSQRRVVFEESHSRVPSPGEDKLHKIALVAGQRELEPEPHDLLVLDYDIKKEAIARYFYDRFLEADLNRSSSQMTRAFLDESKRTVSQRLANISPPLRPSEKMQVVDRIEQALQAGAAITPGALAEAAVRDLPSPGRRKILHDDLVAALTRRAKVGADEVVTIDGGEAQKATRRITYVLDFDVRITGEAADVRRLVQIDSELDAEDRTVIRIATSRFERE